MITPMRVLSLFDGISCGRVAFARAGIPVESYDAYEIDRYATEVSRKNHSDITQHGDVKTADFSQYAGVDILIAGSPCQGFSLAGKGLNFEDPRSRLYFEFERALKESDPKYFLLENVPMKREYADFITERLGVTPIVIDSALVSAQRRRRVYWTNIPSVTQPVNREVELQSIIHENTSTDKINLEEYKISACSCADILEKEVTAGKVLKSRKRSDRYLVHGERVQLGKPGNYVFGCLTPDRINKRQMGQRFNDGKKFYTLTALDRHGILTQGYIRRITPVECERLQTLPDNYTEGIPEPQRYKCLGNGWTVDVITHIFSHIPS